MPARRAPPAKRAQTSSPGDSSTSRSRAPPSPPYQGIAGAPDLSLASIIRRPYFLCDPIPGNVSCKDRDFHGEVYYDLPTFSADPGLREYMLLLQRYHLEPFMVPCQFYYPRVVIEFYHTMTSKCEANPTALHFSIDGRPGILRASNITAALHLPVVLANTDDYRQWTHPSTREMVRLLSMDATGGSILFRQQLLHRMLLIDHILQSNMFPLQHIVQRRGAILEVLLHQYLLQSLQLEHQYHRLRCPLPLQILRAHAHYSVRYSWAEHLHTAPTVHYPLFQGLPGSHGDGPHILSHDSFICSFTGHTGREDNPHRGFRSTDPGEHHAAREPLGPPCCLSAGPCVGLSFPSPDRISSSTIGPCSFLGCIGSCSNINYFTYSTSACPG